MNSHKDTLWSQNKLDSTTMIHYFYTAMLKRKLLLVLFLLSAFPFATYSQNYVYCADSTLIDPYHACYDDFHPYCGCDGKDYISECAAEYWGGLISSHNYKEGICDDFFFSFAPNPVSSVSQPTANNGSFLSIYVNPTLLPTSVSIYIFDVFNRLQFSDYLYVSSNDNPSIGGGTSVPSKDLSADFFSSLEKGVYILIVSVDGEIKTKKIVKINIQ